jgi:hypothetical protein
MPIEKHISACIWQFLIDSTWDIQNWCADNGFTVNQLNEFLNCGEYEMRRRIELDEWATAQDSENVK